MGPCRESTRGWRRQSPHDSQTRFQLAVIVSSPIGAARDVVRPLLPLASSKTRSSRSRPTSSVATATPARRAGAKRNGYVPGPS